MIFPTLGQADSIRIFILDPGKTTDPIRGKLVVRNLSEVECTYEALSYTWGDPNSLTSSIEFTEESLPITTNLDVALRQLRSETDTRTLWIDAVCINQQDNNEKGHQIALMHEIYRKAKSVIMWLGPPTVHTPFGLEILSFFAGDKFFNIVPWQSRSPELFREGLKDILNRDYFQRLWVVQEIALAREVHLCVGSHQVSWKRGASAKRFMNKMKLAEISPQWEQAGLNTITMRPLLEVLEHMVMNTAQQINVAVQPDLLDFIHNLRHRQTSDPRDNIYGLLALDPEALGPDFQPDYCLSKEEIFLRFANRYLEKSYGKVYKADVGDL